MSISSIAAPTLSDLVSHLTGLRPIEPYAVDLEAAFDQDLTYAADFADITIGQIATVDSESGHTYQGRVVWTSSEAEFTPKIIQTKEERVNLVYAIKVEVANEGSLKIGMPGEVLF